jgi:hypothetical protein
MKNNQFVYETESGKIKGFFNVYQARSGKIFMQMGNNVTPLTFDQINDLSIDLYSLKEFDHELFVRAYEIIVLK